MKGGEAPLLHRLPRKVEASIDYALTSDQSRISKAVLENYKAGIDTLIHAVCGAGKTELVYAVMAHVLSGGGNVGFAVPRKDVVIELGPRIKRAFPKQEVTLVYGGHTGRLNGDIVVLTTHQLYRYPDRFDLLILDEIDAFPYKGNDLLQTFFERSVRGHHVIMSATPDDQVLRAYLGKGKAILRLNTRFHGHKIPVPRTIIAPGWSKYAVLIGKLREFRKEGKPALVFSPTVEKCERTYGVLRRFLKGGDYVHSKRKERAAVIAGFKEGHTDYLVSTAVLERGVTIRDLQVIIMESDHPLYDRHALIQIAGRAGRKEDAPDGEVIFLADRKTREMAAAEEDIRGKNLYL